jgi:hypothetical protein
VIRPQLGFTKLTDDAYLTRVTAVIKGLDGNPKFPTPPIAVADLKSAADGLSASMVAALDGGKKAVSEKKQRRADLAVMLRPVGHYVEAASNGDMTTFLTSGFEPVASTHNPPQPLAQPFIVKVDQGNTGQLLVTIKNVAKARNYEIRYAIVGARGGLGAFTILTVPSAKQAAAVNALTPGTLYTFQVRAYGKLGYTDWSDSVMRMVI